MEVGQGEPVFPIGRQFRYVLLLEVLSKVNMLTSACSVLPGGAFGQVLSPEHQSYPSTTGLIAALFTNNTEYIEFFIRDYAPGRLFLPLLIRLERIETY